MDERLRYLLLQKLATTWLLNYPISHVFINLPLLCAVWGAWKWMNLSTSCPSAARQRWKLQHLTQQSQCVSSIWPLCVCLSDSKNALLIVMFQYVDGKTILAFLTLYSVAVFSLELSWNLTTADINTRMVNALENMTVVLHAIFFFCSFFMWVIYFLTCETLWMASRLTDILCPLSYWLHSLQLGRGWSSTLFGRGHLNHFAFRWLAL